MTHNHFVVFTSSVCPWCDKAKKLITEHGDTYTERHALAPGVQFLLLQQNLKTVPQIYTEDGQHIGGYDDLVRYYETVSGAA